MNVDSNLLAILFQDGGLDLGRAGDLLGDGQVYLPVVEFGHFGFGFSKEVAGGADEGDGESLAGQHLAQAANSYIGSHDQLGIDGGGGDVHGRPVGKDDGSGGAGGEDDGGGWQGGWGWFGRAGGGDSGGGGDGGWYFGRWETGWYLFRGLTGDQDLQ